MTHDITISQKMHTNDIQIDKIKFVLSSLLAVKSLYNKHKSHYNEQRFKIFKPLLTAQKYSNHYQSPCNKQNILRLTKLCQ